MMDLFKATSLVEVLGVCTLLYMVYKTTEYFLDIVGNWILEPSPPKVVVGVFKEHLEDVLHDMPKFDPAKLVNETKTVYKWDPSTMDYFGEVPANTKSEVIHLVSTLLASKEGNELIHNF